MNMKLIIGCVLLMAVAAGATASKAATPATHSPTGFLLHHDARVGAVVLKADSLTGAEREQVRGLINEAFDFRELSRRSLGEIWETRTEAEQEEFVRVNRGIIERRNLDMFIRYHRDGGISYISEQIDADGRAVVLAEVPVKSERRVITYALHRPVEGADWRVYDLIIDGASTVEGNRRTWARYVARHSYEKLLAQLRKQLAKLEGTN